MKLAIVLTGAILTAGAYAARAADAEKGAPLVKAMGVAEVRSKELARVPGQPPMMTFGHGLAVKLLITGDQVKGATRVGKVKLNEATDDVGTNLVPAKDESSAEFTSVNSMDETSGVPVDVQLSLPPRKATTIKSLKGELQILAGGEPKTVEVKNLPALIGKKIEDPVLAKAGVEVYVVDPKAKSEMHSGMPGGPEEFKLEVKTGAIAVQSAALLTADGKPAGDNSYSMTINKSEFRVMDLSKPLDSQMTLNIKLLVGQKTVTVPFDLKDVPLP